METDILAQLIDRKHGVLMQLRALSHRQSELVGQGDITRLLSLLAAKQQSLQDLQGVERQLDPFRGQDPESRRWRSPALRQRVRQVVSNSEALLEEIMRVERDCEARLARRRDETAARLQGAHDSSLAREAYLEEVANRDSRLDLTSETGP